MTETKHELKQDHDVERSKSFGAIYLEGQNSGAMKWLIIIALSAICILFLPWTQNIRSRGYVTTLRQESRPQELNSAIAGRIAKWYIKEGDIVQAGDTIVQLSEIKDAYLDPNLIARTNEQITAKKSGVEQYRQKASAIENQIKAIQQSLSAKTSQLKLKLESDSMESLAAENEFNIAELQLKRAKVMKDSGLMSTQQFEQRTQSRQMALAKKISAANKFQNTKTEIGQVQQEYSEKMYKAMGELASTKSEIASGEAEIAKLSNQASNYTIRNSLYYVVAPQNGQVTKATKAGINEIIKEGENLAEIVPTITSHAVEIFVAPLDLPLLSIGQDVKFLFDGYPAIVFSGWPGASYGIYSGKIVAIENNVNKNGKFRVLVAEDNTKKPWPGSLRLGVGASSIALLKNVPVWYELWRNVNGFPPDFYENNNDENDKKK